MVNLGTACIKYMHVLHKISYSIMCFAYSNDDKRELLYPVLFDQITSIKIMFRISFIFSPHLIRKCISKKIKCIYIVDIFIKYQRIIFKTISYFDKFTNLQVSCRNSVHKICNMSQDLQLNIKFNGGQAMRFFL